MYDEFDYGLQELKDVVVQCGYCGHEYIFPADEIEREEWTGNGRMGPRIEYTFSIERDCPFCHNQISFQQRASEYPAGTLEDVSAPEYHGCRGISYPDIGLLSSDDELYVTDRPVGAFSFHEDPKPLRLGHDLAVNVADGDAYVGNQLFVPNKETTLWVQPARRLLPILVEETGSIRFESNRAVFAEIIQTNPKIGAMRLLGKVAEAVIVRNCTDDPELNRMWLSKARRMRTARTYSDRFKSIGTGLHSTKNLYPRRYSPSDTQRDIVWIDNNENYAVINNGYGSGIPAGLQVKASTDGRNYVYQSLVNGKYEVPIAYFGINNDYDQVLNRVYRKLGNNCGIEPDVDFIDVRSCDEDSYRELIDYYPIILDLFTGAMSGDDFVREASGIAPLKNSVIASALSQKGVDLRIIH